MFDNVTHDRRRFLRTAGVAYAAAQIATLGPANAQSEGITTPTPAIALQPRTSFALLKRVDAGRLNIGYAEAGPAAGASVILLHGWSYDIHSTSMSLRCWLRTAIALSFRTCAGTARPGFSRTTPFATVNSRSWPSTSSL